MQYRAGCRISEKGSIWIKQKYMKFLNFHQDPHKNKIFLVKKGVPATLSDPAPPNPTPWICTYNKLMAVNVLFLTSENAVSGIIYSLLRGRQNIFLTLFVVKCSH